MSEAADLIAELRRPVRDGGPGLSQRQIAAALDRSDRMVRKVERGTVPGNLYVPALRQLRRGDVVVPPPRKVRPGQQMTPAGRVVSVTGKGMVGLYQGLALDQLNPKAYASLTIEYKTSHGQTRIGTLYANGGRSVGAIVDDLAELGAVPGDAASIRAALLALADDEQRNGTGGSTLTDVRTIVSVLVTPHPSPDRRRRR